MDALAGGPGKHFDEWINNRVPHPTFLWLGGGFDFRPFIGRCGEAGGPGLLPEPSLMLGNKIR
jgi:hypothetical protein